MKRLLSMLLTLCLLLSCTVIPARAASGSFANFTKSSTYREGQYRDVRAGDWFASNVKAGTEYGIVKGYGDRFGVNDNITILQCIIIACRINTIYYSGTDTIEQDYDGSAEKAYLDYARRHAIPYEFEDVSAAATREQFAVVLASALTEEAFPAINTIPDGRIPDVLRGSDSFSAIYRLYRAGILTGSDAAGSFLPNSPISRCEACVIATRIIDTSLRKTFTLPSRDSGASKGTGDPYYADQWAFRNNGTFSMYAGQNKYPVYNMGNTPELPGEWEGYSLGKGEYLTEVTSTAGYDIGLEEAWEVYEGGTRETIVAIIDTGIDYNHEDIRDSIWINEDEIPDNGIDDDHNGYIDDVYGWNFIDGNNDVFESAAEDHHGTHHAGTIAADPANGVGIAGIAHSKNVKLMILKVIGGLGKEKKEEMLADAVNYARANGAVICNMSLSTYIYNESLYQAMKSSKMLFVCAAGNEKFNVEILASYPARYDLDNTIVVGSVDSNGKAAYYTNYGKTSVDIMAPGSDILSTAPFNSYAVCSGTSMAAPMVTAAAAMLYSHFDKLSISDVRTILLETAKKSSSLRAYCATGGALDLGAAMHYDISKLK